MTFLTQLPHAIKYLHGTLDEVVRDTTTEIIDLYKPLEKIKNQKSIWMGLNLIFPSHKNIHIPLVNNIKCYIATFHGDPIDLEWLKLSIARLNKLNIDHSRFIVCSNFPKPHDLSNSIKYFQIEHLHFLPKWYGNKELHLARSASQRQFNFSFLSNREIWFRTALFSLLYKFDKAILSFPNKPNLNDTDLMKFMKKNNVIHILEELDKFLPLPIDNYFESVHDLQNAWSVNNIAYQNCLINVVNESTIEYFGHMSEKSFKPLISKTLPVYSNLNQITRLEEFGFKFNKNLYANNDDPILRQVNTLKNFLNLSNNALVDLVEEFSEHNRNWFFDNFFDKVHNDNQKEINNLIEHVKNIVD